LAAVVFDMDGTLTEPLLDFALMKRRLNLSPADDIVHHLHSLPLGSPARTLADQIVRDMEHDAMVNMTLARGFHPLMSALSRLNVPKAILTRNNLDPVTHLLTHHANGYTFHPTISRDCVQPTKPHPDPLLHIARNVWQVDPAHVLMVGDGVDDVACAKAAGA
ncbi:HAD-like domain-containing protein, partial [Catenaria anguillulae PL171]